MPFDAFPKSICQIHFPHGTAWCCDGVDGNGGCDGAGGDGGDGADD